jgi:hypothetical protein
MAAKSKQKAHKKPVKIIDVHAMEVIWRVLMQ